MRQDSFIKIRVRSDDIKRWDTAARRQRKTRSGFIRTAVDSASVGLVNQSDLFLWALTLRRALNSADEARAAGHAVACGQRISEALQLVQKIAGAR